MRANAYLIVSLLLSVLGACGDEPLASDQPDASVGVCGGGCDSDSDCTGANERCFGGGTQAALYAYARRCALVCSTTSDCPTGTICVGNTAGEGTKPPVCLPPQPPPSTCGHVDCFAPIPTECADANTLTGPAGDWCGRERVACASGCEATAADGGTSARCRP